MYKRLKPVLEKELESIREAGLFKKERIITTPQGADIKTPWIFESTSFEEIELSIHNVSGSLIYTETFSSKIGLTEKLIRLNENFTIGEYFLSLSRNGETFSRTILKK